MRIASVIAVFLGFTGVALGAFGAHGLKDLVSPAMLEVWKTAVSYQMYHVLVTLVVSLCPALQASRAATAAAACFTVGIIIFSSSLYALVAFNMPGLGMVTPIGGALFLLGWLVLAVALLRRSGA